MNLRLTTKKYKNTLTSVIRRAERDYLLSKFNKNIGKVRETWKVIKTIVNETRGVKMRSNIELLQSGVLLADGQVWQRLLMSSLRIFVKT